MEFGYLRAALKISLICVKDFASLDKCLCLPPKVTARHQVVQASVCFMTGANYIISNVK